MNTLAFEDVASGQTAEQFDERAWGHFLSLSDAASSVVLVDDAVSFGRGDGCTVRLSGEYVSQLHCRVFRSEAGVVIEDNSSNGTYINGERIGRGKRRLLTSGAKVEFLNRSIAAATPGLKLVSFVFRALLSAAERDLHAFLSTDYEMGAQLGAGQFAKVHLAIERSTGRHVAVKVVDKRKFAAMQPRADALHDEVRVLGSLSHPNIIALLDTLETDAHLYLVLELAAGKDLFDRIVGSGGCAEPLARTVLVQLLDAAAYMHARGVVHRDIKPENVLFMAADLELVKLADFGLSRVLVAPARAGASGAGDEAQTGGAGGSGDCGAVAPSSAGTICGTPQYIAPEIAAGLGPAAGAPMGSADMWSLGVLLYTMLSGELPFDPDNSWSVAEQMAGALYSFPDRKWARVSEAAKDLCRRLMAAEPRARWTARQALGHPWVQAVEMAATPMPTREPVGMGPGELAAAPTVRRLRKAPVAVMVREAMCALREAAGSTAAQLAGYMRANFTGAPDADALARELRRLVAERVLLDKGAGRFTLVVQ